MKKLFIMLAVLCLMIGVLSVSVAAEENPTVYLNGEQMKFDVEPTIINGRTMVPMRAIFEALGCNVYWDNASEQAIGVKNGKKVVVAIGSTTAYVGGEYKTIDQPPVLLNDRTLVPLRFISEAYGCEVGWDEATYKVTITDNNKTMAYHLDALSFGEKGDWTRDGSALKGRITRDSFIEQGITEIPIDDTAIASATIDVAKAGTYKVWVYAKDYATNQPGTRYYTISVDDKQSEKTFGQHGVEGFVWEEAGVYELSAGKHTVKLIDTSAFHARCGGILLVSDMDYVPKTDATVSADFPALGANPAMPITMYPGWTQAQFAAEKTDSIENETTKLVFYQGQGANGPVVQNEVYVKDNGAWVKVKDRTEEFAYMLQRADSAAYNQTVEYQYIADTSFTSNGEEVKVSSDNMFEMAPISWLIPTDYTVLDGKSVQVTFKNEYADATATFTFDDFATEPQVTLNATFKQDGAYSFVMYNGNGVEYEAFDTVTAPLLYVKHAIPEKPLLITEPFMFTPMNTLYFEAERNAKGNNKEFTSGLVVDPSIVRQGFSYPETAQYATAFYTPDNKIRPHLVAPVMGVDSDFKAGDTYSFKFRMVNNFGYWYDTYKHVAVDMYKVADIRDNYYTSFNEAIYNTTELWLDDLYGGWDDKSMSYWNMEAKDVTTQADPLEATQRYLLTDDLNILEERTVPTIAYMLSHGTMSFQHTAEAGGLTSSYITTEIPSPIGKPVGYSAGVFGGLYEMTQGRMPYLLDHAINEAGQGDIASLSALYKYTGDKGYYNMVLLKAEDYLNNTSCVAGANYDKMFTTGFVYTDYVRLLNTLLLAYEYTGDQKYLDAADKAGQLTMTSTWSTGYHNGYDYNTVVMDDTTGDRPHPHDDNNLFFWHGSEQWRVGNVYGEYKSANELGLEVPYEEVPGWLPAQAGSGTEHPFTPRYGAINQMNVWAGSIMRLAAYTGDEHYVTQARNAMIGRFGNYSGYGRERYITNNQHPDFPYKGPDYVTIYYHHIPVFMGMLEDYLINDVWYRSNQNIEFPTVFQQGYAYFDMNRYGQEAGKFYDQEDMWLWVTPDVVTPDNRSIDYITARKDGVLGVALVNEKQEAVTTTITLGSEVENAAAYNGTATLYDADGNKSTLQVTNGQFTVTVPGKGIQSVVLENIGVTNPSFVREYIYSNQLGQTVSEHTNGKGFVIQLSDEMYHAYTYVTDKDLQKLEITYTADGKTETKTCDTYPFEFIVKVEDINSDFQYSLKATLKDGTVKDMGGSVLRTLDNSQGVDLSKPIEIDGGTYYSDDGTSIYTREKTTAPAFKTTEAKINRIGRGTDGWKFIVEKSTFPFDVNDSNLDDLKNIHVIMKWVHKSEGTVINAVSYVNKAEMADNGARVALWITPTFALPAGTKSFDNASYTITMQVSHTLPEDAETGIGYQEPPKALEFEPFEVKVVNRGRDDVNWRFVATTEGFPFEVETDKLFGTTAYVVFSTKDGKDVRLLKNAVKSNEMRADGGITIVVPATEAVPLKYSNGAIFDDKDYTVKFILAPANYSGSVDIPANAVTTPPKDTGAASTSGGTALEFDPFEITISGKGRAGTNWRYVVSNDQFPFEVTAGCMAGLKVKAVYTHKDTKEKLEMESVIQTNEDRADGKSTTLVVPGAGDVTTTKDGATFDDAPYNVEVTIYPAE